MITNEEAMKAMGLVKILEKISGMDMNPFTVGAMSGVLEGLASDGRTITIERKSKSTLVTLVRPGGDEVSIEKESLLDILLEMFQPMHSEEETGS